jgi:hypothetical protein
VFSIACEGCGWIDGWDGQKKRGEEKERINIINKMTCV